MLIRGDARYLPLADESVQTVVTSPPYWGLRDYGLESSVWGGLRECDHSWGPERVVHKGGPPGESGQLRGGTRTVVEAQAVVKDYGAGAFCDCGAWRGVLGLEPTPDLYSEHIVEIFREAWRVLKPDGTVWLNLGDSWATGAGKANIPGGGQQGKRFAIRNHKNAGKASYAQPEAGFVQPNRMPIPGLKPKDLVGIPWRVAFALQADGWYLRSEIIWHKPNPMPESVTDRTTKAHETIFLLSKSLRYYYDAEAIREPDKGADHKRRVLSKPEPSGGLLPEHSGLRVAAGRNGAGRNKRSVWVIATQPYKGSHFATFPPKLIEPCILAGAPEGGVVLDPFVGSGTTVRVAESLRRLGVGVDLSYQDLAKERTRVIPRRLIL